MTKETRQTARTRQRPIRRQHDPLQLARQKLGDAISDLIDPQTVIRELNGRPRTEVVPSRYEQLCDALTDARGSSHNQQLASLSVPFWIDAMTLAHNINLTVAAIPIDEHLTVLRLRALDHKKWRPQDTQQILDRTADLERLAKLIDRLFAPKPKYLPDPCPRCEQTNTSRFVDGETVRTPALSITVDGAECGACHETWAPGELAHLGLVLGYPHPEGVIT